MSESLPALLLDHARARPGDVALRQKVRGVWRETTWHGYGERVARVAAGLRALGVGAGERVAIHAENRAEWVIADLAVQALGAVAVGVYPTSPAAEVEHLLGHSEAAVLIASDEEQLDKALAVRERCPALRRIVVVDPRGVRGLGEDETLLTFAELEALGAHATLEDLARDAAALDPHATAIVVYTSGTTGPPKGAMISHANIVWAAERFREASGAGPDDEVLSYLPLCHVAERLGSIINAVGTGYVVNFGEGPETFVADLREVQPTVFLGVPRVWEKMLATVETRMADASRLKRWTYRAWMARGRRLAGARMRGGLSPAQKLVAGFGWLVLYRPLRDRLGLARVHTAMSAAAPIAPQVLEFFWALGVPVREGYGQTEDTAVCTSMPPGDVRIGTVGTALEGVELRIAGDGEILTRSGAVFQGYVKDPDATAAAIDADGWLHTGDVGEIDDDGYLTITDRMKGLIVTAGAKNVSPSEIEGRFAEQIEELYA